MKIKKYSMPMGGDGVSTDKVICKENVYIKILTLQ